MNTLLKAILKEASDLFNLGEDVLQKKGLTIIVPALIQAGSDISGITGNISDFQNEVNALLSNPAADEDLLSYATGLVAGDGSKAQALITAAAKLALDVIVDVSALVTAFNIQTPVVTPAPVATPEPVETPVTAPAATTPSA